MRYLAIDLGDKRTGLAAGDALTGLVTPLEVLSTPVARRDGEELLDAIAHAATDRLGDRPSGGQIVVGLPVNMDGTEGQRARLVRAFAARIGERTGRTVHLQDERLTSADAEWELAGSGLTHKQKKERRDALAAAAILRDFLERQSRTPPDEPV
jgi:putative Holliday junction resolvase